VAPFNQIYRYYVDCYLCVKIMDSYRRKIAQDSLFLNTELAGPNSKNYYLFGFFLAEGTNWVSLASLDHRYIVQCSLLDRSEGKILVFKYRVS
jgi:hypothetical protein